jgi:DNA repair protein RecO (recombination protein O)
MLVGALRSLAARDAPLLVPAFFLKLLAAEGFEPMLDVCAACGSEDELVAFDLTEGGALCASCRRGPALGADALVLMRRILGGGLAGVLDEPSSVASAEVERIATNALEHHIERRLRSPQITPNLRQ